MKRITSADNPGFRELLALASQPRAVRDQGRTLIEGAHLVQAAMAAGLVPERLLLGEASGTEPELTALVDRVDPGRQWLLAPSLYRRLSVLASPAGVMAVIPLPDATPVSTGDIVLLDALQDPGNVGAVLRCAAAAGIRDVVLGDGCAGAWAPRTLRAGQGAQFALNLIEQVDLAVWLDRHPAVASRMAATVVNDGTDLYEADLATPVAWLIGNEGAGVSADLTARAFRRLRIPLASSTESLNVAAAAAVCFFEARRQRRAASRPA